MSTDKANRAIDATTRESIERAIPGGHAAVDQRLAELQREWDIDRVLMVNFATLVFAQLVAATRDRRWLWGPLVQTPFLMMHAILGWCPPSLWFRPMGFRTRFEIQPSAKSFFAGAGRCRPERLDATYGAASGYWGLIGSRQVPVAPGRERRRPPRATKTSTMRLG